MAIAVPQTVAANKSAGDATRIKFFHTENPLPPNRVARFLEAFAAVLEHTDYKSLLDAYCASATKCTQCAVACHVYQATHDPRDIPCYRANILLETYTRYFTMSGWLSARLGRGFALTEELVDELAELLYRCNVCRRCTLECPLGIDHGLLTRLGRYIFSLIGIVPKALQVSVREQLEGNTGNTSKIPKEAMINTLSFLAEEIQDQLGISLEFPVDQPGREHVFFCAVSDYLLEPDTLMGNAAVLYAAGDWDKWTIGSGNYDGINYGLFYSDWHLERIVKRVLAEAERLQAKNILIGECGHASRAAHDFIPVFGGRNAKPVLNFMEYTYDCLLKGKIRLDPTIVSEKVTYHDPCNIARSGWIVRQPREILKTFVKDFVDMTPAGQRNYCCGGGGGLVSCDETHEFRMEVAGRKKAEQIRETGAQIVVAPCANCKKQLKELVKYHHLPCQVMGLHDLILKAIVIPGAKSPQERKEESDALAV
ncbi:MAG: (Fe-S)-binding protein [Myxococcales bacterium]|nr:MAG: (Fe-S)-binding protein [Myxococcales bacterium]